MTVMLAAGDRVPVDATVIKGTSELDVSLVSGEQTPLRRRLAPCCEQAR